MSRARGKYRGLLGARIGGLASSACACACHARVGGLGGVSEGPEAQHSSTPRLLEEGSATGLKKQWAPELAAVTTNLSLISAVFSGHVCALVAANRDESASARGER
jgi:hypothetical protein